MSRSVEGTNSSLVLRGPPPDWAASFAKCCVCSAMLFPVALGVVLLLAAPVAILSGILWLGASSIWPSQAAHAGTVTFIVFVGVAVAMTACAIVCARRHGGPGRDRSEKDGL